MPATEYQPSFLGRISTRRNQVMSMEGSHEQDLEDLELFQRRVAERFSDLLLSATQTQENSYEPNTYPATAPVAGTAQGSESLLSISWLRKLVDVFLCCESEFKAFLVMSRDPSQMAKPPLDRLMPELLERSVKLLDICNAVSCGVDHVRQCQMFAEMAINALRTSPIGDGQIRRARKALALLHAALNFEDKENAGGHYKSTERAWSFGKRGNSHNKGSTSGVSPSFSFRSYSMSVAKNWSAAKQIQAMCANLTPPRGGVEATGLPSRVYIISMVMVLTMWVLVAAIPCQERNGLNTHFQLPRHLNWAHGVIGLQEKLSEEWKKKEKNRTTGLMEEIQRLERLGNGLMEIFGMSGDGGLRYPLDTEKEAMVQAMVTEMSEVCRRMDEGLLPLQQQIREVFHKVVRSRSEILELMDHASGRGPHL